MRRPLSLAILMLLFLSPRCWAQPTPNPVAPSRLSLTFQEHGLDSVALRIRDARVSKGASVDLNAISAQVTIGTYDRTIVLNAPARAVDGSHGWVANSAVKAQYKGTRGDSEGLAVRSMTIQTGVGLSAFATFDENTRPEDSLGRDGVAIRAEVRNGAEVLAHCGRFTVEQCRFRVHHRRARAKLVCRDGEPVQQCGCGAVAECTSGDGCCPSGCGPGTDGDCKRCFVDLSLTVVDECHELEWEKKTGFDPGTVPGLGADHPVDLHDVDNLFTWSGWCAGNPSRLCQPNAEASATCAHQTGGALGCEECPQSEGACLLDPRGRGSITTIWDWLNRLNAVGLAGHQDWRIPTSGGYRPFFLTGDAPELESFIGQCAGEPNPSACVAPIAGPIPYWWTWSASTIVHAPDGAWPIQDSGSYSTASKANALAVRAVRSRPGRAVRDR